MDRLAMRIALVAVCGWQASPVASQDLTILNARVVDVAAGEVSQPATLRVRDGRFVEPGTDPADSSSSGEILDAAGAFLVPGLWDSHVHLANNPDAALSPERQLEIYLSYGVTGVRDMGGDPAVLLAVRRAAAEGVLAGPRIFVAGPFLDGAGDEPVFRAVGSESAAQRSVGDLQALGVDFIKVQAGLQPDAYAAILEAARDAGMTVAGHVPDALTAFQVIAAGQRTIEHVSPALPSDAGLLFSCSPRAVALREELAAIGRYAEQPDADRETYLARIAVLRVALLTERTPASCQPLFDALRQAEVFVVPTLVWSQTALTQGPRDLPADLPVSLLPEEVRERLVAGREAYAETASAERLDHHREVALESRRFVGDLHRAGVRIVAGTDAFSGLVLPGFSLHQELLLLVESGLSNLQALRSATLGAAELAGNAGQYGTIAVGKRADFLVVRGNPLEDLGHLRDLVAVVQGGIVRGDSELMALRRGQSTP